MDRENLPRRLSDNRDNGGGEYFEFPRIRRLPEYVFEQVNRIKYRLRK